MIDPEIEVVYEDYDPEDDAPEGTLTPDVQAGDCAGEDVD